MDALEVKNLDCREAGSPLGAAGGRAGYIFNSTIAGIEDADAIMLIGTNPRLEAPVLNARIRKRYLSGGCTIGVIGERADLTYPYAYLGDGPAALADLAGHKKSRARKPMFIIGQGALSRPMAPPCWQQPCRQPSRLVSSRVTGTVSTYCTRQRAG